MIEGMRALGLCLGCSNALEIVSRDSVLTMGRCCWQRDIECHRLNRHWPGCSMGEDVFSQEPVCTNLVPGTPSVVVNTLLIIKPK